MPRPAAVPQRKINVRRYNSARLHNVEFIRLKAHGRRSYCPETSGQQASRDQFWRRQVCLHRSRHLNDRRCVRASRFDRPDRQGESLHPRDTRGPADAALQSRLAKRLSDGRYFRLTGSFSRKPAERLRVLGLSGVGRRVMPIRVDQISTTVRMVPAAPLRSRDHPYSPDAQAGFSGSKVQLAGNVVSIALFSPAQRK